METLDELRHEIKLLESLRVDLQFAYTHPKIGGKTEIILTDMRRVNKRIEVLLYPALTATSKQ